MNDIDKQKFNAHLAEYNALRAEVTLYSQRIDRTVGIYLTALFGLLGYLLRPDSVFSISEYLANIQEKPTLSGVFLMIGILNSLLIIRIQSFYLAVLAMSQYTATVIKPRISELIGSNDVLEWDDPNIVRGKVYWLPARSAAQSSFWVLVISVSVFALVATFSAAIQHSWLLPLLAALAVLLGYSVFTISRIVIVGRNFHEQAALQSSGNSDNQEP